MAFTTITVTGSLREADGSAAEGQVEFELDQELYNAGSDEIAVRKQVVVALDGNGDFSTDLYATNDPDTTPVGGTYLCRVRTDETFEFHFELDNSVAGGTVDLADIERSSPSVGSLGVNIFRYVGTQADPVDDPNESRPNVSGPVYWVCAAGVTPVNSIAGDLVFNAD